MNFHGILSRNYKLKKAKEFFKNFHESSFKIFFAKLFVHDSEIFLKSFDGILLRGITIALSQLLQTKDIKHLS